MRSRADVFRSKLQSGSTATRLRTLRKHLFALSHRAARATKALTFLLYFSANDLFVSTVSQKDEEQDAAQASLAAREMPQDADRCGARKKEFS